MFKPHRRDDRPAEALGQFSISPFENCGISYLVVCIAFRCAVRVNLRSARQYCPSAAAAAENCNVVDFQSYREFNSREPAQIVLAERPKGDKSQSRALATHGRDPHSSRAARN